MCRKLRKALGGRGRSNKQYHSSKVGPRRQCTGLKTKTGGEKWEKRVCKVPVTRHRKAY